MERLFCQTNVPFVPIKMTAEAVILVYYRGGIPPMGSAVVSASLMRAS